ncbi:MAG TPA: DUF4097 family beta strand repeat-containing protein [Candidatus Acidoferrum sp.]|nr:DUF4097 family beta strand repeat-containing protein [Candidatus Acidoferrum sp.]
MARIWGPAIAVLSILLVATVAHPTHANAADDNFAEGQFDKTLKVTGPVNLTVDTGSGSISVRPGDGSTVHVIGRIRVHEGWGMSDAAAKDKVRKLEANPPIVQEGNTIHVGEIRDEELRRNVSISYEVVTPAETQLHSSTGSGSQMVEGVRGPVEATTGSGSINGSKIGNEMRASTGSGTITLEDIKGSVRATTGSGGIRATGIAGGLSGRTGSGTVEYEQTAPGDVDIETGSGGIELRGVHGGVHARAGSGHITVDGTPTGDWRLHTGSGGVTMKLPPNAGFELDASTGSGSVSITPEHELTVSGTINRHELRGKAHGGGPLIYASTSSGSIRVE